MVAGFRSLGWEVAPPRGSMFVWLPVPAGYTSPEFSAHLIDAAGVVVTPGHAFGPGGEGWFRVSLVADIPVLEEAMARIAAVGVRYRA